jgi:hypothetical protein
MLPGSLSFPCGFLIPPARRHRVGRPQWEPDVHRLTSASRARTLLSSAELATYLPWFASSPKHRCHRSLATIPRHRSVLIGSARHHVLPASSTRPAHVRQLQHDSCAAAPCRAIGGHVALRPATPRPCPVPTPTCSALLMLQHWPTKYHP